MHFYGCCNIISQNKQTKLQYERERSQEKQHVFMFVISTYFKGECTGIAIHQGAGRRKPNHFKIFKMAAIHGSSRQRIGILQNVYTAGFVTCVFGGVDMTKEPHVSKCCSIVLFYGHYIKHSKVAERKLWRRSY